MVRVDPRFGPSHGQTPPWRRCAKSATNDQENPLLPLSVAPRLVAIAASGAVHAAVFASLAFTASPGKATATSETILILEPQEQVPQEQAPTPPVIAQPIEPVPNEATHLPSSRPQASPASPPAAPAAAAPDFLERVMTTLPPSDEGELPSTSEPSGGGGTVAAPNDETTYGEDDVSIPARLLSHVDAAYPMPAWSSGIEADVPVEIVVDTQGAVASARVVTNKGHGFDDAALTSLKSYRFEPAQRDHHAVRVRVRWSIQFRVRR